MKDLNLLGLFVHYFRNSPLLQQAICDELVLQHRVSRGRGGCAAHMRRGASGGGGGSLQHRVCLSADVQISLNIVVGLGTYIVYDKS